MKFRNDDVVAGDLPEVVGDRPVVGDAALEDDVSVVPEEEFSDAGHDGAGLGPAGAADDVAQRETVFEFVDRGRRQHRADRGEFQVAVVVDPVGHLIDRHVEFGGDAVEERTGSGGADAAHLVVPHAHLVVENHRLAVLPADVEDRLAVGVVVTGSCDVGGDFAHPEVVGDELRGVFDDLTAGDDGAGDLFESGQTGVEQKFIHCLAELAEVAGAAFGTHAGAPDPAGIHRFGALVESLADFAAVIHQNGFECGRADVDAKVQFFHKLVACLACRERLFAVFQQVGLLQTVLLILYS